MLYSHHVELINGPVDMNVHPTKGGSPACFIPIVLELIFYLFSDTETGEDGPQQVIG